MKLLLPLIIAPTIAFAGEQQVACNLEKDRAEVQASVLSAPQAFGQVGDTVTSTKNVVVGVSQSFSGIKRARLIREAADAKCDAMRATIALDKYGVFAVTSIQQKSAATELISVNEALDLAKKNLELLDAQLVAQTITIIQHTAARQVITALEMRKAELIRVLSKPVEGTESIAGFVDVAKSAEANAARLAAEAGSEAGWDVKVAAGARQPITGGGSASAFATIAFTYSFGYDSSKDAARRVGTGTAELMSESTVGYAKTVQRQRGELEGLVIAENALIPSLKAQLANIKGILKTLEPLDTALALNTKRDLNIQAITLRGQIAGAEMRSAGYAALLIDLK